MIYQHLAADENMMEVVTIKQLANIDYSNYNDKRAPEFLKDWMDTCARMDNKLDDSHKRDLLYTELKKSTGLKIPLLKYKDMEISERRLSHLISIYKKWLQERKEDGNYSREMVKASPTPTQTGAKALAVITKGKTALSKGACHLCGGTDHW